MIEPKEGDVWLHMEEAEVYIDWLDRLIDIFRLRSFERRQTYNLRYRRVTEVRLNKVFYDSPELGKKAEWLSEWLDWQLFSKLIYRDGVLVEDSEEIRQIIADNIPPFEEVANKL